MAGLHTITLPVRGDGKGDNVFAHAAALARQHGAHVRVLHCRLSAEDLMPFGVAVPGFLRKQIEEAAAANAASEEDSLHEEFRAQAAKLSLPEAAAAPGRASASFVEFTGKQVDAVKHYGRLADLICVPQPDRARDLGANTLKSAIFSSGRPVMMCPERDAAPDAIGTHVAIGWNGSLEASRALALAMPLVEAARTLTILTAGTAPPGAAAEDCAAALALRGVAATVDRFEAKGTVGRTLLKHCNDLGADLLVMGAYHDSYERETIFGGNSQAVVDDATIPVVLAH
ncbi:MAG: universal stress protein [Rhodobacter sp.]|nr:universal stress protein [Rhodobacter sp.]